MPDKAVAHAQATYVIGLVYCLTALSAQTGYIMP